MNYPILARTREHVAIHEAGHAVVAYLLGLTVERIEVSKGPDGWGGNTRRQNGNDHQRKMAACGGHTAERLVWHRQDLMNADRSEMPEKQFIRVSLGSAQLDMVKFFGGANRADAKGEWPEADDREFLSFAYYKVFSLLQQHRHLVERVADALVLTDVIEQEQFLRLMAAQ